MTSCRQKKMERTEDCKERESYFFKELDELERFPVPGFDLRVRPG